MPADKNFSRPVELLAPAGSPACALAAYDAGADAVYAGLAKFNARERGENFTPRVMAQMIEHAHRIGKKFYVTFNTLIRENELPEAVETLALLAEAGPDALLVQDIGLIRIARKYFPGLTLHASTQMGFHNSAGLKIARSLGLSRVVLERQMTFGEIAAVKKDTDLELEVFVHGALCASLSGECYFSSVLGGCSGNRGKCKQPCRRRYFSERGNGFFFSPQDLCLAEKLPVLRGIGVASLKIEGRLRQPDYVLSTVSAYRMLLDAPDEKTFRGRLGEARAILSRSCGRHWSEGYCTEDSARSLLVHKTLGAAGMFCGKVSGLLDNGFTFTTSHKLLLGDRLRIQPASGDEGPAVTVTRMFVGKSGSKRVSPGQTVTVLCDKPVAFGSLVYKIGENFPDYSRRIAALPPVREKLDLHLELTADVCRIKVLNAPCPDWEAGVNLAAAEKHPADEQYLAAGFAERGNCAFRIGAFSADIRGDYFVPAAELKRLRKSFWEFAAAHTAPGSVFRESAAGMQSFLADYSAQQGFNGNTGPETVLCVPGGAVPANRKAVRAAGVYSVNKLCSEAVLPDFCPEKSLPALRKAIKAAYTAGIKRFRVTSLYGFRLLSDYRDQETVKASSPLPVCNSQAALELQEQFGVTMVMAHIEMEREDIEALIKKSPVPVELYRYGRPAVLTTRAGTEVTGRIKDSRGNEFTVEHVKAEHLTRVFCAKTMSVPRIAGAADFYDLSGTGWNAGETMEFNFNGNWM